MAELRFIYSEPQLRDALARYHAGEQGALEIGMLAATASVLLANLDEARAQCVRLLARSTPPPRPAVAVEALLEVRDDLVRAAKEPHEPAVDCLIDAMIGIVDYLDGGAKWQPPKEGA